MARTIKRKNKTMESRTLSKKGVPAAAKSDWPLTEKDYLLNLTDEEVKKLGKDAQAALREYKAGKTRPIESLFDLLK